MDLLNGILNLFTPFVFLALTGGVAWGIVLGALPGLGASVGIALLIPFTFGIDPRIALAMFAGVYAGAVYGGGITSILVGVPGTSADAATVLDGYPMAQKGLTNKALTTSVTASSFGGMIGAIVLLLLAPPLARVAVAFGPHEFFLLAIFGLAIIAALSPTDLTKGLIAGGVGLAIGTIGIDPITGSMRYTFDFVYLYDGLPLIPAILGLFAVPRCIELAEELLVRGMGKVAPADTTDGGPKITWAEIWSMRATYLRSAIVGTVIGIIPAAGANIAAFVSYAAGKQASKNPERYGTGIAEGVAAAEGSQNSTCSGSLVPLLTLSIPGSPTAAVILGGLLIHGLVPGPELFTKHAEITYTFIAAGFFANIILLVMGWYGSRLFGTIAQIPVTILVPGMLLFSLVGAFAVRQQASDLYVMMIVGAGAWAMTRFGYPMASVLLGFVLGPMAEAGLRRALLISQGDWMSFFQRPLCLALMVITAITIWAGMNMSRRIKRIEAEAAEQLSATMAR